MKQVSVNIRSKGVESVVGIATTLEAGRSRV